jgi:D-amino peptidase
VKEGLSTFAALHLHPEEAQRRIQTGAERAVRAAANARPWPLPAGCRVELTFDHQARADQASYVPSIERAGERIVAFTPADALDFAHTFRAAIRAASIRMSP